MANKLSKRYFGATGSAATPHIPVRFKSGGSVYEGYIVNQVSARRFKCSNDAGSVTEVCKLVQGTNSDPASNGEMTLVGMLNGSPKTLKKINFRTVADFSSNRYKWTLQDDSTETLLILTAI